jgi:hypothetical protein
VCVCARVRACVEGTKYRVFYMHINHS